MATHSSMLAWRIPWTEEPGSLQSMGLQRVDMTEATEHAHMHANEIIYVKHLGTCQSHVINYSIFYSANT